MTTRINQTAVPSIRCLPRELVVDILATAAARSLDDFFNAKLSCREWNELSDDSYIYKHASISKLPIYPGWKPESKKKLKKASSFFRKCMNAGNLEALYKKGVMDYWRCKEPENALGCLKKAASAGHVASLYAICIISIFVGGEYKKRGLAVLGEMKKTKEMRKEVRKARRKLIQMIQWEWVHNVTLIHQEKPVCCTVDDDHHKKFLPFGPTDSDDEDSGVECGSCKCDVEISYIYQHLPRR